MKFKGLGRILIGILDENSTVISKFEEVGKGHIYTFA